MKRFGYLLLAVSLFAPGVFAQDWGSDHINVGVYGNFLRLGNSGIDLGGVGARLSVNIAPKVQLEAESAYDFEQAYSPGFSDANGTLQISRSHVRALDGLFGPKFYTNRGPVRLFVTAKGGFINFNLSNSPRVNLVTVENTFNGLNGANMYGVFYPGGGAEAFWGPIGLRVDVGDEIYFKNGAHNTLRVSAGPTIRF
ncbi:MAG: hypothetical protein ACRD4S_02910 [Candidatus Acidiferrales bacterium]